MFFFFFSSRRRHTRSLRDWSSDVCSSDLDRGAPDRQGRHRLHAELSTLDRQGQYCPRRYRPEDGTDKLMNAAALSPGASGLSPLLVLGEDDGEVIRTGPRSEPEKVVRRDRATGFTLIEVMVALAVVAIALVGLLGLQDQTLQSVVRASDMTTAA